MSCDGKNEKLFIFIFDMIVCLESFNISTSKFSISVSMYLYTKKFTSLVYVSIFFNGIGFGAVSLAYV